MNFSEVVFKCTEIWKCIYWIFAQLRVSSYSHINFIVIILNYKMKTCMKYIGYL